MNLYLSLMPEVFTAILVQYTITESLLESLLESLFESLLESHVAKTPNREVSGVPCKAFRGWNNVSL